MTISYQTVVDCDAVVIYGLDPSDLGMSESGSSSSYYSTYDHHVVLTDLEQGQTYYYKILPDGEVNTFTTPHASGSESGSEVNFVFFGDHGLVNGDSTRSYLNQLADNDEIDLIFHAGDVGYADDSFLHLGCIFRFCYEEKFNEYMDEMMPIVKRVPWMTMPGNHEAGEDTVG
jgi:hypothetical protein